MRNQSIPKNPLGKRVWGGGININVLILQNLYQICKSSLTTLEVVDLSFKDLSGPVKEIKFRLKIDTQPMRPLGE